MHSLWIVIAVIWLVDLSWSNAVGIHLEPKGLAGLIGATVFLLAISFLYSRTRRSPALSSMAQSCAALVVLSAGTVVLSYLVTQLGGPLWDSRLEAVDSALGFDWPSWFAWVAIHPWVKSILSVAYALLAPEMLFCVLYLGARNEAVELLWMMAASSAMTIVGSALFPAMSLLPNYVGVDYFVALRRGELGSINLLDAQGLITMPSFHMVLAILMTYAVRRHRRPLALFAAVNSVMVISLPTEGGHYAIDCIAGAAVAVASIMLLLPNWSTLLGPSLTPIHSQQIPGQARG
jgi:hypothetical protein